MLMPPSGGGMEIKMIEFPETHVLANQIQKMLVGKRIARVQSNRSPHKFAWFSGDPQAYPAMLEGKTVMAAGARTGFACNGCGVLILCGDKLLIINTPVRYHQPGEKLPAKHQLLLEFEDSSSMSCTVKMWGSLFCVPAENENLPEDRAVSPLSDAFDADYLENLRRSVSPGMSLKGFLATEQRIPGLGNGVLQDILWNARLHPKRRMESLTDMEMQALFESVKNTLRKMIEQGGRDTEKDLFGNPGGYKTVLSKLTLSCPCERCGSLPVRESFMGGNIYFCPSCQSES